MEKYFYLIPVSFVCVITMYILAYDKEELLCKIINRTLIPKIFMKSCLKVLWKSVIVALSLYLLIEHTWLAIGSIAAAVFLKTVSSYIDSEYKHNNEMRVYKIVLRCLQRGYYQTAENVLNGKAKNANVKEFGKLHSSLLKLIHTLRYKGDARRLKVSNIDIYNPIPPNRALVPITHYQMNTKEQQ